VFDWFACYCSGPPRHVWNFERKSVLAAHVANTKEAVRLKDVFTVSVTHCVIYHSIYILDKHVENACDPVMLYYR